MEQALFHLRDGDIVVVPTRRRVATISGAVRRPGAYEIREKETLAALILIAGGRTAKADRERISLLRVKDRHEAHFMTVESENATNFFILDGDQAEIATKPETRRLNVVEIKGEGVRKAGAYEHVPGMTVVDLIEQADGLHDDAMLAGAVRVRTQKDYTLAFTTVDLQAILVEKSAPAFSLEPLDRIIVYSAHIVAGGDKYVTVTGHVKEPGKYLLSKGLKFSDLLFMAGGFGDRDFLNETWLKRADLVRVDPETQRNRIIPVDIGAVLAGATEDDIALQSMDQVRVYSLEEFQDQRRVLITGEVRTPGEYELTAGMTLQDLVTLATGLSDSADPARIEVARYPEAGASDRKAAELIEVCLADDAKAPFLLQRDDCVVVRRKVELRENSIVNVSGEVRYPGQYVLQRRTETLADIIRRAGGFLDGALVAGARLYRHTAPAGAPVPDEASVSSNDATRIVIDMPRAWRRPGGPHDLVLLDGDRIHVPRQNWMVDVQGEVAFPRTAQYIRGASVRTYLGAVGGYTSAADRRGTVLIYPNGEVRKARRFFFFYRNARPDSTIFVPAKPLPEPSALSILNIRIAS